MSPLLLCILALHLIWTSGTTAQKRKPNVLFLVTDQQRFDAIRRVQDELPIYANSTKIRTPNLDRLSRMGAYFRNAYCQCPVCGPARTSLRTGCTIERTGVQTNDVKLDTQQNTLFTDRIEALRGIDQILFEQGYVSEHYGKWHMPSSLMHSHNQQRTVRFNDFDYSSNEFYFKDDSNGAKLRRYLKHFEKLGRISKQLENGQQYDSFTRFPYTPIRIDSRYGYPTGTPLNNFSPDEKTQPNLVGSFGLPAEYTPSSFTANVAIRALQRLLQSDDEPWFLTVSFHNPHPPMVPAAKHLDYYWQNRDNLLVPPNLQDKMINTGYKQIAQRMPKYQDPKIVQEWTATYYALVEEIDEYVGRILDELEAAGALENTLIVFTSDHGEMLGAHGKREKNNFYEESLKVPLFVSFPGVIEQGLVTDQLVSHIDIVATILDYVGATDEDIKSRDGSSLRPLLEKRSYNEEFDENVVVAEWDYRMHGNNNKLTRSIDERPPLMVRKGDWKLMIHRTTTSNEIDMMFNLASDPYELNNVIGKNAPTASTASLMTAEHLRCLLVEWMQRMDGDQRYYSDPANNYGEGNGDISDVQSRQSWPALGFWMSDTEGLQFGPGTWIDGRYTRNEYMYLGTRTSGDIPISKIEVVGPWATFVTLDANELILRQNTCHRIKVTFDCRPPNLGPIEASILIQRDGNPDINIPVLASCPSSPASPGHEVTSAPTESSTGTPTSGPTSLPEGMIIKTSTASPSETTTSFPSVGPTATPTTGQPTEDPTLSPSENPTVSITDSPTGSPTTSPARLPTDNPTTQPSEIPNDAPFASPSGRPSSQPTEVGPTAMSATGQPTENPTLGLSESPTDSSHW